MNRPFVFSARNKSEAISDDIVYVIFGATVLILWRLDRLGRQLEAVCANIKINLATTQERSDFF